MALTEPQRAVRDAVGQVLFPSGPAEMARVAATLMALPAGVRDEVRSGRCGAMNALANHAVSEVVPAAPVNLPVTVSAAAEGPNEAFVAFMLDCGG
jgi:hypothetical protein